MRPIRLTLLVALAVLPRLAFPQGGQPLGPEFRINTFTTLGQAAPSVSSNGAGSFVVVWQSPQDGSGYGIFGQRFTASGVPLAPEFLVNTFTTGNQAAPAVAVDLVGSFIVLWQSEAQDGSGHGIFGQKYSSAGAPVGTEFRVNSFTTGDQIAPSVGFDKLNAFYVAWTSDGQDGSGAGIYGQRFGSPGFPMGPEFRVNATTAGNQRSPSIAANMAGNSVVVWESEGQDAGASFGVFGQRYLATGAPAGSEFRINTHTTGNQIAATITNTLNNFVVAWQSYGQDGSSYGVFSQRYTSNGVPLGAEFRVNTFGTGYQMAPGLAGDANGDFVVVWESAAQDGSGAGVFGQRYASSGAPLGAEFRVNTFTTNGQSRAVAASSLSANFVVIWQSDLQDGSSYGVFGQRYSPILPVDLMHFRVE